MCGHGGSVSGLYAGVWVWCLSDLGAGGRGGGEGGREERVRNGGGWGGEKRRLGEREGEEEMEGDIGDCTI